MTVFRKALAALTVAQSLAASAALAADKPVVAAVNYPLAYFAERLGGDAIEVLFPVPADRDPAFWRPSLADIAAIQQADLIALNGAGYAAWTEKASLPRSRVVDTSEPIEHRFIETETVTHSHGDDGEHSHQGLASHTWLDFALAAQQAEELAAAMKRRLPDLAERIEAAEAPLRDDLESLYMAAYAASGALDGARIIATHPRYQYFARAFQLEISALEWEAGEAPTEAQWDALAALAGETGARILIWEAEPPADARERAAAMGLRDVVFPTLANRPAEGDFVSAMRASLDRLAALGSAD